MLQNQAHKNTASQVNIVKTLFVHLLCVFVQTCYKAQVTAIDLCFVLSDCWPAAAEL